MIILSLEIYSFQRAVRILYMGSLSKLFYYQILSKLPLRIYTGGVKNIFTTYGAKLQHT